MNDMHQSMIEFANTELGSLVPVSPLSGSAPAQFCTPTTVVTVAAIAFTACTWTALGGKVGTTPSDDLNRDPQSSIEDLLGLSAELPAGDLRGIEFAAA